MNIKLSVASFLLSGLILSACSGNKNDQEIIGKNPPDESAPSVETNPANTSYAPAFSGQTRIAAVKTTTPYTSQLITSALASPWGIVSLPDGRLLITEKAAGRMRIVTTTGTISSPITGIPTVNSGGQGGLLGLCLDPSFASNRMVYWVFAESVQGGNITSVAKGRLSTNEASIENATVIYRSNTPSSGTNHYGGRILFDRNGNLIISIGERSDLATRPLAQSVASSLGKIIRLTTSGQPSTGNPTFTSAGAIPELYSIGHRNPQGLALHPVSGDIWQSEHGPRGGDELNRVLPGANYGWPTITYGIEYGGAKIGSGIQQQTGMEHPIYYWDPVISPSGMTFYSGTRIPEWQNNLFIGALSGTHIARLVIANNKVIGEERLLTSVSQRFRDVTQGSDGALYAITDAGRLYKIDKQ
ncbi:MAG: PQQ-dependent sugar dehydrogenase [Bacteroidia bacterium]